MSDREEFEEAAARLGYNLKMADTWSGEYISVEADTAWHLWQEARAQPAQQGSVPDDIGSDGLKDPVNLAYCDGWNDCRKEMLTLPEEGVE